MPSAGEQVSSCLQAPDEVMAAEAVGVEVAAPLPLLDGAGLGRGQRRAEAGLGRDGLQHLDGRVQLRAGVCGDELLDLRGGLSELPELHADPPPDPAIGELSIVETRGHHDVHSSRHRISAQPEVQHEWRHGGRMDRMLHDHENDIPICYVGSRSWKLAM